MGVRAGKIWPRPLPPTCFLMVHSVDSVIRATSYTTGKNFNNAHRMASSKFFYYLRYVDVCVNVKVHASDDLI